MSLFSKKKEPEERELEYVGLMDRASIHDATQKKKTILPVVKQIYQKIKSVIKIDRNYELVEPPESLLTISRMYNVESYFRRSVDRFVELIWKNKYQITGSSKDARDYVVKRFEQIARVTDIPTEELLETISQHLVKYYNCFILKIRNNKASGGRNRTTFYGKFLKPVAGYFIAEPTNMLARRDRENGRIKYWENFDNKGKVIGRYIPEDVIHITMNKRQNELFGTPAALSVIDDIMALRRMEENVEILVFQHAIPLVHYKVGSPEDGPRENEVEDVQAEIDNMVVHGMLVTDGRHDIKAVGVRGETLDIDRYLQYFRDRILMGLSQASGALGFGSGNTSATNVINKMVLDTAARFQRRIKTYVERYMINELLEEGKFDTYDEKNQIELFFPEIDLDDRIRREFHVTSLWQANLITEDEARAAIGKDPMSKSEFEQTFFAKITIPKIEIQARAQAEAAVQLASVASPDSESTGSRIGAQGTSKKTEQQAMPRNQYGTKRRSGAPKRGTDVDLTPIVFDYSNQYADIIRKEFRSAAIDIEESRKDGYTDGHETNLRISEDIVLEKTSVLLIDVFKKVLDDNGVPEMTYKHEEILKEIHENNGTIIQNLFNDTTILIGEVGNSLDVFFDGIDYKVKLAASWMVQKTYTLASAVIQRDAGYNSMSISKNGVLIDEVDLDIISFDSVHPHNYESLYKSEII